jgi:hypothetical protein
MVRHTSPKFTGSQFVAAQRATTFFDSLEAREVEPMGASKFHDRITQTVLTDGTVFLVDHR